MAEHVPPDRIREIWEEEAQSGEHAFGARVAARIAAEPKVEIPHLLTSESLPPDQAFAIFIDAIRCISGWSEGRVVVCDFQRRGSVRCARVAAHPRGGWILSVNSVFPIEESFIVPRWEVSATDCISAGFTEEWIFASPVEGENWRFTVYVPNIFDLYALMYSLDRGMPG